jgi:hypothetical protein
MSETNEIYNPLIIGEKEELSSTKSQLWNFLSKRPGISNQEERVRELAIALNALNLPTSSVHGGSIKKVTDDWIIYHGPEIYFKLSPEEDSFYYREIESIETIKFKSRKKKIVEEIISLIKEFESAEEEKDLMELSFWGDFMTGWDYGLRCLPPKGYPQEEDLSKKRPDLKKLEIDLHRERNLMKRFAEFLKDRFFAPDYSISIDRL